MRKILKIAQTELATLFYSPIAWLILVIFAVQAAMSYSNLLGQILFAKSMGSTSAYSMTIALFAGGGGVFQVIKNNLYLYIPLLTMGLMSREFSSGSIKLLYSSPLTGLQIILGKYLSITVYGLVLVGILALFLIFTVVSIDHTAVAFVISGLVGIYLLICSYAAIGLFMSCLTSYQIVAAIGTLGVLSALNFVGGLGQDILFIQDITSWLSISGRIDVFIEGVVSCDTLLYYIILILLFLALSVMKLQFGKQRQSKWKVAGSYTGVVVAAMLLGYATSRPVFMTFFWDSSESKFNTLVADSRDIVAGLKGDLTITTYVNLLDENYREGLPASKNEDAGHFKDYLRFKPDIKMTYVYYYKGKAEKEEPDTLGSTAEEQARKIARDNGLNFKRVLSPAEIDKVIDLAPEEYRFVRVIETADGRKTFLRLYDDGNKHPREEEISAALRRLIEDTVPCAGFVYGHGERSVDTKRDRDYNTFAKNRTFRNSLINQGFDVRMVSLKQEIPAEINTLVIADPRSPLSPEERARLDAYVAAGGNLMIAAEPDRLDVVAPLAEPLGVRFIPGTLVQPGEDFVPDLLLCPLAKEAALVSWGYKAPIKNNKVITMLGAVGIECDTNRGFTVRPILKTFESGCWNELVTTNFTDERPMQDSVAGEVEKSYITAVELSRNVGEKEQIILILGDADCVNNSELSVSRPINSTNFSLVTESFRRFSGGKYPVDTRRSAYSDHQIVWTNYALPWINFGLIGGIPFLLALGGMMIWMRRKGR